MIKAYITPQLSAIKIDKEISLRLNTVDDTLPLPTEPGLNPGGGGNSNGTNTEWNRVGLGPSGDKYGTGIWK